MVELIILIHCYGIGCVSVHQVPFPTMKECAEAASTVKLDAKPKSNECCFLSAAADRETLSEPDVQK